jgi:chromosome partitioning protein
VTVIPTGPSLDDLHPTVLLHHELIASGMARERIVCAICRTLSKGEEADARDYLEEARCNVLPGALPERAAYRAALNQGRSVTETNNDDLNVSADRLMETLLTTIARVIEQAERTKPSKEKGHVA